MNSEMLLRLSCLIGILTYTYTGYVAGARYSDTTIRKYGVLDRLDGNFLSGVYGLVSYFVVEEICPILVSTLYNFLNEEVFSGISLGDDDFRIISMMLILSLVVIFYLMQADKHWREVKQNAKNYSEAQIRSAINFMVGFNNRVNKQIPFEEYKRTEMYDRWGRLRDSVKEMPPDSLSILENANDFMEEQEVRERYWRQWEKETKQTRAAWQVSDMSKTPIVKPDYIEMSLVKPNLIDMHFRLLIKDLSTLVALCKLFLKQ